MLKQTLTRLKGKSQGDFQGSKINPGKLDKKMKDYNHK